MRAMQPTTVSGIVTPFKGNGRKLGYPTANLTTRTELADGVYFGFAELAAFTHHPALIFVGIPTTLGDTERRIEVYLLDIPDQDYYGEALRVILVHYHRANQTFKSVPALLAVMKADERTARLFFEQSLQG